MIRPAVNRPCWVEDLADIATINSEVIDSLFPAGLTVLIGSPKAGKTNFIKLAAAAIATGNQFANAFYTQKGRVLLALYESSAVDISKTFKNAGIPPLSILYYPDFPKGNRGLIELENILEDEKYRLIAVDTFGIFKGTAKLNDYTAQYKALEPLNKLAEETGTALVFVTHTKQTARKNEVGSAGFRNQGLRAVATSTMLLDRNHGKNTVDLRIESRKAADRHFKFFFDSKTMTFQYRGEVDDKYVSDEMAAILRYMAKCPDRPNKVKDIAVDTEVTNKSACNMLNKAAKMEYVERLKQGFYIITDQGMIKSSQTY